MPFGVLLLIPLAALAVGPGSWVPARWQGGPLELLRRAGASHPDIIRNWYHPRTLDLLEGTPINCLLVTWSTGAAAAVEAEQQQLVAAYARAAHERRIALVGLVYPGADPGRTVAAALDAGLAGLALEGDFADAPQTARELRRLLCAQKSSAVVLPLGARDWLRSGPDWPVLGSSDAAAPRIRVFSDSGAVTATPTGEPWVESNIWLVRSWRAWGGERPIWLGHGLDNPSADDYARAIADAAVAGGRWVVAPDDALRAGLWNGQQEALATWRRIGDFLNFYEQHAEWRSFAPAAALGILQVRAGPHADVADETLNLITRRRLPYRLIERSDLSPAALEGLPALLATGLAPTEGERKLLAGFARKGGLLVAYQQDPPDPETLSKDLVDLIGNDNLPVRLFNVASVLAQVTGSPDGTRLLVQLVNYATEPVEAITVRASGEYRRARLFSPGAPPADLKIHRSGEKIEAPIARLAVAAALLLEK